MDKAFTCPHCGAALYIPIGTGTTVCDYCRSQIIVDRDAMARETAVQQEQAIQARSAEEYERAVTEYGNAIKKWKKKVNKATWSVFAMMVFCGISMDHINTGIGVLAFMLAAVMTFVYPVKFGASKPLMPEEKSIPAKASAGLSLYPRYAGAFWAGLIVSAVICTQIWVK